MFGMIPFERGNDNFFDLFDNFERRFFGTPGAIRSDFRTDIKDEGEKYVLQAELPGFRKEDIKLDVKEGILTISAQQDENKEEKDEKTGYIRQERRYGSFCRSFDISGVDDEHITASYQDGILELTLPKTVPAVPESRQIAIE